MYVYILVLVGINREKMGKNYIQTNVNVEKTFSSFLEAEKLKQHLVLLKQEYAKLQERYNEVLEKYSILSSINKVDDENSFASRLFKIISTLYNCETFSDITIKLSDCSLRAHKLILAAHSEMWNEDVLCNKSELDWSNIDKEVGEATLLWMYTNKIKLDSDNITLKVMHVAYEFKLHELLKTCEQALISNVTVRNCVKFYSVAEDINAVNLRDYCSALISTHWEDLDSSDFEHMLGPLLYKMLKNKTQLPLYSAVRLQREDVVFLCLVENSSKVSCIYYMIIFKLFVLFDNTIKSTIPQLTIY